MQSFPLRRALIILFCLWHMTAVAVYLLPRGMSGPWGARANRAISIVSPYVLSLSQWQEWNIFSPDPIRHVSEYRIESNEGNRWDTVLAIDEDYLSFYERAKELKILERMESTGWKKLAPSYLQNLCPRLLDVEGREIRLVATWSTIPNALPELAHRSAVQPKTSTHVMGSTRCAAE